MPDDRIQRWISLEFPDREQELRYLQARDAWLRTRIVPLALLIAVVFLGFILFDLFAAPHRLRELAAIRLVTAAALVGIGLLGRYRPDILASTAASCLLAAIIYVGVMGTRMVVGLGTVYEFNEAIMLIQVGTWFFGGVTFLTAARLNAAALLAYLAIELFVIGDSADQVGQGALYLCSLYVISGIAARNIERQFRANFASSEELARQKRDYRARAMRDGLTGLWNRQAMEEKLVAACASCLPGVVFMIDLDGFKPINDLHGHQAGDEALTAVARRVQSVLRPGDAVGRIGGDEFLVLAADLPEGKPAIELAERIRSRIEAPIRLQGESGRVEVNVGASIGSSHYAGTSVPVAELMRRADASMYEDKAQRKAS